jgi:hypothetical protein
MSKPQPPRRWLDEKSSGAPRSFAEAARGFRADGPSAQARARMWEMLGQDVAVSAAPRGWRMRWRMIGALLVIGAIAMPAIQRARRITGQPPPAADASESRKQAVPLGGVSVPQLPVATTGTGGADDRASVDAHVQPAAPAAHSGGSVPSSSPHEQVVTERRANISATTREPANKPQRRAAALDAARAVAEEEVSLLVRARRLLHSQPERALALTARHADAHPRGVFAEERELLAIEAESLLGRRELADRRIARFLATFPGSAHRSRVVALRSRE